MQSCSEGHWRTIWQYIGLQHYHWRRSDCFKHSLYLLLPLIRCTIADSRAFRFLYFTAANLEPDQNVEIGWNERFSSFCVKTHTVYQCNDWTFGLRGHHTRMTYSEKGPVSLQPLQRKTKFTIICECHSKIYCSACCKVPSSYGTYNILVYSCLFKYSCNCVPIKLKSTFQRQDAIFLRDQCALHSILHQLASSR